MKNRKRAKLKITARINQQITAPELRVLDETGQNLGVMNRTDALGLAQEKGLDLIEISSSAKPPVSRIMNFDKFRYLEEKKLKKQAREQKQAEIKQIQIGIRTARNDLMIRIAQIEKFFAEGHPVSVVMVLHGREKANKNWAKTKLNEFLQMIPVPFNRPGESKWSGRGFAVQITKK